VPERAEPDRPIPTRIDPIETRDRYFSVPRRCVELHGICSKVGYVERHEAGAAQAGIYFREPEQGVDMRITRSTSATAPSISAKVCSGGGRISASSSSRERNSANGCTASRDA